MKTIVLLGSLLFVSACRGPAPEVAEMNVFADISSSSSLVNADAAVKQAGDVVAVQLEEMMPGDRIELHIIGEAKLDLALSQSVIDTRKYRTIGEAEPEIIEELKKIIASHRGGDDYSNIERALVAAKPVCTPRSRVVIFSDGMENGQEYSAQRALALGQTVKLPEPTEKYLTGCKVVWVGLGNTALNPASGKDELLTNSQTKALKDAWIVYLKAAGAKEGDILFL